MSGKASKQVFPAGAVGLCGLFCTMLMVAVPAFAQNCDTVSEEITRLRPPAFANYTQWDEAYGTEGMERISDLSALIDGSVVAVGSYTKDEEDPVYKPLLMRMTPKGEVMWETREEAAAFKTLNRIVPVKGGYITLGDLSSKGKGNGIYIARYSDEGKRTAEWPIYERDGNVDGMALAVSPDGKSIVIAAQINPEGTSGKQYGVLYKYTMGGKRVWRHGYSPGTRSVFHNLQVHPQGGYIVSGEVQQQDSRMAAWLIRVDDNGAIMWQRAYARGDYAGFLSASAFPNGDVIVSGLSKPVGSTRSAGWVMKVDQSGQTVWQRYYAGMFNYAARDVMTYDDGRSVVLLDATPYSLMERGHVRLLTFSPRGYLMNVEEFSEGQGAHAVRLIKGPKDERIVGGYTQVKYAEVASVNDIPVNTYDSWLVAAESLDPYEDPCLPKSFLP